MVSFTTENYGNGLSLIYCPMREANSVGINIFVGSGGRFEEKSLGGISHFLEHMVFKGTEKYRRSVDISQGIEGIGGLLNGYTDHQVTSFHAKVPAKYFSKAFEILSNMVFFPLLRVEDIQRERGVVVEEIRRKKDNPRDEVFDLANEALWGDSSLGRSVLGSQGSVRGLTRGDLVSYHLKHYQPGNIVVSIAGNLDEREVIKNLEKASRLKGVEKTAFPPVEDLSGRIITREKSTAQAHLVFIFPGFSHPSKKRHALEVISSLLGTGMSSRLFLKVRDRGLAYSVFSSTECFSDRGAFVVYAGVEKERAGLAIKTILGEIKRLKQTKVASAEMTRAIEKEKGPFLFKMDEPLEVSEYFGYQMAAFGRIEKPEEYLRSLDRVESSMVREISEEVFDFTKMGFVAISPIKKEEYLKFLRHV